MLVLLIYVFSNIMNVYVSVLNPNCIKVVEVQSVNQI